MIVRSVFTVISVCKTEILDTKGGEPIFQGWGGRKKGGREPKFFQNLRGGAKAKQTMMIGRGDGKF